MRITNTVGLAGDGSPEDVGKPSQLIHAHFGEEFKDLIDTVAGYQFWVIGGRVLVLASRFKRFESEPGIIASGGDHPAISEVVVKVGLFEFHVAEELGLHVHPGADSTEVEEEVDLDLVHIVGVVGLGNLAGLQVEFAIGVGISRVNESLDREVFGKRNGSIGTSCAGHQREQGGEFVVHVVCIHLGFTRALCSSG